MESPQILIDTSILIDYFRKRDKEKTLLYSLSFTYRFAISTVTEFEFFAGLSAIHLEFTNKLFANFLILPFDSTCPQTASVVNYYKIHMPEINEATDTDLKIIEKLQQLGRRRGDTFALPRSEMRFSNGFYQQGNK